MTLGQFGLTDVDYLKFADLENMFNVFQDQAGRYFFNLNETAYFDFDEQDLLEYTAGYEMQWTLVSYAIYGTTRLAWFLMKVNGVTADRMFETVKPAQTVKYVSQDQVNGVLSELNGIH